MIQNLSKSLEYISKEEVVVGFMRHSEREPIPAGEFGTEVKLTKKGQESVLQLNEIFKDRITNLYSSPVLRCMETANLLKAIAKNSTIIPSNKLGDPGILVKDAKIAAPVFLQYQDKPVELALSLINRKKFPGFCESITTVIQDLISFIFSEVSEKGVTLCISHDSILGVMIGYFFPEEPLEELWPDYLDTLFVQKSNETNFVVYRGKKKCIGNF